MDYQLQVITLAVSDIRHKSPVETWAGGWAPGADPERHDYASFADFADPDGNPRGIQEIGHRTATGEDK